MAQQASEVAEAVAHVDITKHTIGQDWIYAPNVVGKEESLIVYEACTQLVNPIPNEIFVWGKMHTERRLTGTFSRVPSSMTYSGKTRTTSGEWPVVFEYLAQIGAKLAPPRADGSIVKPSDLDMGHINLYRDGTDDLGYHWDKDGADECIISFSFYQQTSAPHIRDLFIRDRCTQKRTTVIPMGQGSAVVMFPSMQKTSEHSVPARKLVKHGRINVTLRQHHL